MKRPRAEPSKSEDDKRADALASETKERAKKYRRGDGVKYNRISDKKLKGQLKVKEKQIDRVSLATAQAEKWLLPGDTGFVEAEGVERTQNLPQSAMLEHVPLAAKQTAFDLKLTELGPYTASYSRNGRSLLLAGQRGHMAMLEWKRCHMVMELQAKETVSDVCFLHNELFFAAAQKKYVFLYDKRGIELHCLRDHAAALRLRFLPQHFLLTSIGRTGVLTYTDTSTGTQVVQIRTRKGRCVAMSASASNGVLGLGHANGTGTLWSPNLQSPLATWLAHRGPITALDFDSSGNYVATGAMDGVVKVWDVRKFQEMHTFFSPSAPSSLSFSQKGLLAVSHGSGVEIWKDAATVKERHPYLRHRVPHGWAVEKVEFCPYEDVLGVGHAGGFTSMLVPGAGEPNFDSYVANPFETAKQRREGEIQSLLDKLPPETITLDPDRIGGVRRDIGAAREEAAALENEANRVASGQPKKEKNRAKGRNKSSKRFKRRQLNVIDEKRQRVLQEKANRDAVARPKRDTAGSESVPDAQLPVALSRFKKAK